MYKTIRHGENSLQYTILPQNDDFRLEGKIKAAGGGSKKTKAKKPKRRSFFAYLGLLFVCTVIIGAVLVPFLVSAECLPNPTEWFLKTKNAFSKKPLELKENVPTHLNSPSNMINKGNLALNVGKPVKIINKNGVEKFILKVNKTLSTDAPKAANEQTTVNANSQQNTTQTAINREQSNAKISITHLNINEEIPATLSTQLAANASPAVSALKTTTIPSLVTTTLNDNNNNNNNNNNDKIIATIASVTTTLPQLSKPLSSASVPNVPRASLQSALNQNSNSSSTQPTITTRIMQVPLLKSTAKKPAIPPVLVKNLSPIQPTPDTSNLNDILPAKINVKDSKTKEAANSDWIHSHWPYIDPSTYFQWNGYKTEDSVLLPALLGFALIGVILIITVCLVARNKRTIVTSVRKRNRNDLEETGAEDNTTLLTNTNLSDED